jgi:quercetin dioxygenase-like cupin family protein
MKKTIIAALALVTTAGLGYAAGVVGPVPPASSLDPKALKMLLPENIQWRPAEGLTGTDAATIVGDPTKEGEFYVVLNRFHPGNFSRPHYHANDRYIMVISGEWWVDTGGKFDPNRTVPLKPGTFVTHAGREVHYDGARAGSGDAIVMIFGRGPSARHECEGPKAETGPGPCADAKAAAARAK